MFSKQAAMEPYRRIWSMTGWLLVFGTVGLKKKTSTKSLPKMLYGYFATIWSDQETVGVTPIDKKKRREVWQNSSPLKDIRDRSRSSWTSECPNYSKKCHTQATNQKGKPCHRGDAHPRNLCPANNDSCNKCHKETFFSTLYILNYGGFLVDE